MSFKLYRKYNKYLLFINKYLAFLEKYWKNKCLCLFKLIYKEILTCPFCRS